MSPDTIPCSYQIKDTKKSSWNSEVFRNCKLEARIDGFCTLHHPKNIATLVERAALSEIVDGLREIEMREEATVGAFMRIRRNAEFSKILSDIRDAEEMEKQLRYKGFGA